MEGIIYSTNHSKVLDQNIGITWPCTGDNQCA